MSTTPTDRPDARSRRLRAVEAAAVPVASAARFSETVRVVVGLARRARLRPPVFRSPPRLDGVDRTIRRRPGGTVVVAVRRDGRPLPAVQADVIEGVVAANGLTGAEADRFRHRAWQLLEGSPPGQRPDRASPNPASRDAARRDSASMEAVPPARVA